MPKMSRHCSKNDTFIVTIVSKYASDNYFNEYHIYG